MSHMSDSDAMVEKVYDLVNGQQAEAKRLEIARAAYLAAQYRATQLAKKAPARLAKETQ